MDLTDELLVIVPLRPLSYMYAPALPLVQSAQCAEPQATPARTDAFADLVKMQLGQLAHREGTSNAVTAPSRADLLVRARATKAAKKRAQTNPDNTK